MADAPSGDVKKCSYSIRPEPYTCPKFFTYYISCVLQNTIDRPAEAMYPNHCHSHVEVTEYAFVYGK